ncbi:unnamed protein product, partial [Prunus brigantina]
LAFQVLVDRTKRHLPTWLISNPLLPRCPKRCYRGCDPKEQTPIYRLHSGCTILEPIISFSVFQFSLAITGFNILGRGLLLPNHNHRSFGIQKLSYWQGNTSSDISIFFLLKGDKGVLIVIPETLGPVMTSRFN